jgi:putative ABC transport system permease protein
MAAEVAAIGVRLDTAFPVEAARAEGADAQVKPRRWSVRTLEAVDREMEGRFLTAELAITSIVGLVLVVACTNLANLVLARGSSRVHEIAVRRALGASRARVVADQLAESVLLAAMGAVGAFLVTRSLLVWFGGANLPIGPGVVTQLDPRLDLPTLTLAALSVLASLVVFGLAPALQLTRAQLRPALSGEGGSTSHVQWRTRRTLIAVQVMISLSFFLIAAFAVRMVSDERAQPSGIDVDRLAMGRLGFYAPQWNEPAIREMVDRLQAVDGSQPGLESVTVMSGMPFGTTYTPGANVTTTDKPFLSGRQGYPSAMLISATPSVFATLGVPIVKGRGFDARDSAGSQPVAVLSGATARQLFGTTDVVGRECLLSPFWAYSESPDVTTVVVIGIAGDTDTTQRGLRRNGVIWVPLAQRFSSTLVLVGRTSGDPAALVPTLKALVKRADPDLALDAASTAALTVTGLSVLLGIVSELAGWLAVLALALGMAGLFGVMSHLVSRRTREMGVRVALGAEPQEIRALILRDGLQPVASGLTMGYLIAAAVRLLIRSGYQSPLTMNDAVVFVLAPLPILVAAFLACYWPAKRASGVDPNVALRYDG